MVKARYTYITVIYVCLACFDVCTYHLCSRYRMCFSLHGAKHFAFLNTASEKLALQNDQDNIVME